MLREPMPGPSVDAAGQSGPPLQVGLFTDFYLPMVNGAVVSMESSIRGLRAAGHRVTIFAPRVPGYRDADADVCRLPSVQYMHTPPLYMAVPGAPGAVRRIRRSQFDVLHVHSPAAVGLMAYLAATFTHVPLIYTNHCSMTDYTHYIKVVGGTRPARSAARWFSATSANLSDRVVVPSVKIERVLREQGVRRPIDVIPSAIDLATFRQPGSPGAFRQALGMAPGQSMLLFVGRVAPEKRIELLIDMFAHLAERRADVHMVIAGDGNARPSLEAQARATCYEDRIHFLGMVDRSAVPALLHDADLFVSATTTETQCLALVEAIAAGLPVAAVWDDAFEGILVEGVNGRIAPLDAVDFADVVCRMLGDPAQLEAFGRNSVALSDAFSIEAQAGALVALYRKAIAAHDRKPRARSGDQSMGRGHP